MGNLQKLKRDDVRFSRNHHSRSLGPAILPEIPTIEPVLLAFEPNGYGGGLSLARDHDLLGLGDAQEPLQGAQGAAHPPSRRAARKASRGWAGRRRSSRWCCALARQQPAIRLTGLNSRNN